MSFAARALSHRSFRRRHLAGLVALLVLLLWGAAWTFTAFRANNMLDRWIEAAKAKGTVVEYSRRHTNGSPFSAHIHFHDLTLASKNGSSIRTGEAVVYVSLWEQNELTGKLRDGIEGVIASTPFTAAGFKFGLSVPEHEAIDHNETGLSLTLHPFVMTLKTDKPLPFGNTLEEGLLQMRVMGPAPDFSSRDEVKAWTDASGVVEFDRLYLHWGPMILTGSGTLGLDPELQPEGAFSGRVEGIESGIAALVEQDALDKRQEALLRSSLHVLSRPSGLTGNAAPIVPITVQGGGLFLGPVKLLTLPAISW